MADSVTLKLATLASGGGDYFIDLLDKSLKANGHEVRIKVLGEVPQKRLNLMVKNNHISLIWLVQSEERDKLYVPVEVGITNGLIGHRVLLIPRKDVNFYRKVNSLAEFRQLNKIGAFGKGWFDAKVWRANSLEFVELDGAWQSKVYNLLATEDRGVDYFSRGLFEIVEEANQHPDLAIEPHLMLIYDRDFRFYLSPEAGKYKAILEESLLKAKNSGLMDELIQKHWHEAFEQLKPEKRVKIYLETPKGAS